MRRSIRFARERIPDALSISIGVAVRRDETTLEALLARADAALTVAKRNGRNRVERAP